MGLHKERADAPISILKMNNGGFELEALDYIKKPIQKEILLLRIHRMLGGSRMQPGIEARVTETEKRLNIED
ncbi:MAG: hypothetical protein JRJ04_14690 [Deltaproteobacteria bacterium]|nr:hypothetical protein [Deltaproteobacteria bacterium]